MCLTFELLRNEMQQQLEEREDMRMKKAAEGEEEWLTTKHKTEKKEREGESDV